MKNLKRVIFCNSILLILLTGMFTSCLSTFREIADEILDSTFSSVQQPFTNEEAISAMKDALVEGINASSKKLSQKDAYYKNSALKILLPPEADPILNVLNKIPGGQTLADDVILRLNRTAESTAKDTISIFTQSIKEMTVVDGIKVVSGSRNAATEYLRSKCYNKLVALYKPKISSALNKNLVMNVSANSAWTNLVTNYNKYAEVPNSLARLANQKEPFPAVEVDLAKFATEKALDGLFIKIAEEEGAIRDNPYLYASNMIKKVFGSLKNK